MSPLEKIFIKDFDKVFQKMEMYERGTGISLRGEELLKGNGISGGAARVLWCKRGHMIGQSHIIFYFIFSCLFKIHNIYYQRGIKGLILGF